MKGAPAQDTIKNPKERPGRKNIVEKYILRSKVARRSTFLSHGDCNTSLSGAHQRNEGSQVSDRVDSARLERGIYRPQNREFMLRPSENIYYPTLAAAIPETPSFQHRTLDERSTAHYCLQYLRGDSSARKQTMMRCSLPTQ